MNPYYKDDLVTIFHADCREILPSLKGISAVITDPPYEIGFMSKKWDNQGISFQSDTWRLIGEACLPGAMLLSFGGTRTSHRLACAIEDAGWQIRDTIMWVYGSGFPKSLDISKAIDKKAGGEREEYLKPIAYPDSDCWGVPNKNIRGNTFGVVGADAKGKGKGIGIGGMTKGSLPATPEAKLWEGYGTALKPAYEPIVLAMKPLDGTFANNALKWGVAGLNIDECRIPVVIGNEPDNGDAYYARRGGIYPNALISQSHIMGTETKRPAKTTLQTGRFPSNFIHDGSQEVMELFPNSKAGKYAAPNARLRKGFMLGNVDGMSNAPDNYGDSGSAARFFYCAKSSRRERDAGLEDMPKIQIGLGRYGVGEHKSGGISSPQPNPHPTVKPLSLMTYLCKLVKMPEYNLILDPFCGSGTTLLACKKLGIPCIGIESSEEYCEIAKKRVNAL